VRPSRVKVMLAALVLAAAMGFSSSAVASEVLEAKWLPGPEQAIRGRSYPLALQLNIVAGMHINANQPDDPNLIPTQVSFTAPPGLSLAQAVFPQAKLVKLGFAEKPLPVFDGVVLLKTVLQVGEGVTPGLYQLSARVSYQGCNNEVCLMPESQEISLTVKVVSAGR